MTEPNPSAEGKPSRAEASRQRRSARAIAAERQRKQTTMRTVAIAVAAIAVVAIVGFFLFNRQQTSMAVPDGIKDFAYQGAQHSEDPVTYAEHPPVGGVHNPVWQNCGYYASPVPNENAVHSLEHGAVWITYQPDLPGDQVQKLKDLADGQSFILVSPMDGLPSPVVASAWNHQLQLQSANDAGLEQFIRLFRLNKNAPEPGAACAGGTSATLPA
ncbi:MAG: DUF3105 domain-containing protein [Thermomicrobiales bacterium]